MGGGDRREPLRWRAHHPPEGVRRPSDLLLDENLLEHRVPAAAQLRRHVRRDQTELAGPGVMRGFDLACQLAVVHLGFDLDTG